MSDDAYAVLCVTPDAPDPVIAAAYKALVKLLHPDVSHDPSTTRRMARINAAYDEVRDPAARRRYDARRPIERPVPPVQRPMPFGKHKGTPLSDVPVDYLFWALENIERPISRSWARS